MKQFLDISYGQHPRQVLDIYSPKNANNAPVVLFWHGGSWRSGDKRSYVFAGRTLAKMGYKTILPNYRLYPEIKYPEFLADAALATAWVHEHIKNYGGNSSNIFLAGHSAGAYIATMLACDQSLLKNVNVPISTIKGLIGLSGAYDFSPRPDLRPIFPAYSPTAKWLPVAHASKQTPPALLVQGNIDWIVNKSNAVSLNHAIQKAGGNSTLITYPHLEHFGTLLALQPLLAWLAPVRRHIRSFITKNSK